LIPSLGIDWLIGFRLSTIGDVVETYPILIEDAENSSPVEGEILEVSEAELLLLDAYEGDWYVRRKVGLKSEIEAWVYTQ
jgi:gamma-glutamylcyclotransferase (GGCT)/AIG2-like uncharacterized protein YtfP